MTRRYLAVVALGWWASGEVACSFGGTVEGEGGSMGSGGAAAGSGGSPANGGASGGLGGSGGARGTTSSAPPVQPTRDGGFSGRDARAFTPADGPNRTTDTPVFTLPEVGGRDTARGGGDAITTNTRPEAGTFTAPETSLARPDAGTRSDGARTPRD